MSVSGLSGSYSYVSVSSVPGTRYGPSNIKAGPSNNKEMEINCKTIKKQIIYREMNIALSKLKQIRINILG